MNGTTSNQIRYALQETQKALAYFQDEIQKDPLDLASQRNTALAVMLFSSTDHGVPPKWDKWPCGK